MESRSSWNGRSSVKTEDLKKKRIGVLMGGLGSEREVSLQTGAGVLGALRELGYDCVALDWTSAASVSRLIDDATVAMVWNALHGTYGEDGAIQGFLTCMGIPYTGSKILASALAMDKIAAKRIFDSKHVPTPPWRVLAETDVHGQLGGMPMPVVVKPANEGSSVGVTIVRDAAQLEAAVQAARECSGPTMVEQYIPGAEIQVGILDGEVLGSIEVRPAQEFYDYDAKYERDDTQYLIPPPLDATVVARTEAVALEAHLALGCEGHSRVDLRVTDAGEPYCLEVNTLPGMTSHSLLPKIAAHQGISYGQLCERILMSAV